MHYNVSIYIEYSLLHRLASFVRPCDFALSFKLRIKQIPCWFRLKWFTVMLTSAAVKWTHLVKVCKMSWAMLCVSPPMFKPVLREYRLLIGYSNYMGIMPYIRFVSLAVRQVCLRLVTFFHNLQPPDLLQDRLDSLVVKCTTSLFIWFCSNVMICVCHFGPISFE